MSLYEAARVEMETYHLVGAAELQPKWDVPTNIVIGAAVSARFEEGAKAGESVISIPEYIDSASRVIEAGACTLHIDFSWVSDEKGRRLDKDIPSAEAYAMVLEPLRARHGMSFVADLNVLNGSSFDACMGPVVKGMAEVAPCAAGHPEAFVTPAAQTINSHGVRLMIGIHNTGEVELAKRRLIDTGIVKPPYLFAILYGVPFDIGRSLVSSTAVNDTKEMTMHLFAIVDQIRKIDPTSTIMVCAAGRSTLYMTTLATMMGLQIRIGTEDTPWKYPNSDERFRDNVEMMNMAREIAGLHGRRPATANEYRTMLGLAPR